MPKPYKGKKKRKIKKFRLDEISAVDRPCQPDAVKTLLKRAPEEMKKAAYMLSDVEDHTHIIEDTHREDVQVESGNTSYNGFNESYHSHPWIRQADGKIIIGIDQGHTHEIVASTTIELSKLEKSTRQIDKDMIYDNMDNDLNIVMNKQKSEDDSLRREKHSMSDEINKEVEELTKKLAKAEALASMSDAEKSFYKSLKDSEATDFLKKSSDEKAILIKKANDADEEVELEGRLVKRSTVGSEVFEVLKKQASEINALAAAVAVEKASREMVELKKRAEDTLSHLPGTVEHKAEMLKSIESISNEEARKSALDALSASNKEMSKAFERKSVGGAEGSDEKSVDKLEKMAKKHSETNNVSFVKAYAAVMATPEGNALYASMLKGE